MLQSIKKEVGGTNVILFSFRHSYRMPPVVPLERREGGDGEKRRREVEGRVIEHHRLLL